MVDLKSQTLLVVAPHPDDEVLGCGGLIRKIKKAGGRVYILFLTVGKTYDYARRGITTEKERLQEIEKVAKFLQYDDYAIAFPGDHFHLKLDQIPQKEIILELENGPMSINKLKPTIIATTHETDYNQDHRVAAEAVFAATRPAPEHTRPLVKFVLGYESMIAGEWAQVQQHSLNFYVGLSEEELEAKVKAMGLYKSQKGIGNHQRKPVVLRHIAHVRGLYCGLAAAEAFYSYRSII